MTNNSIRASKYIRELKFIVVMEGVEPGPSVEVIE